MKKNLNRIFLTFAIIGVSIANVGCSDDDIYLEDPGNVVYQDYYKTEAEFRAAVEGMYQSFFSAGYYAGADNSSDMISMGEIMADNVILNPNGRQAGFSAHVWNFASAAPSSIYESSYMMIARANAILDNIDNLDVYNIPTVKAEIRAHALAVRALAHFEISRWYLKIPTQSSDANSFVGIAYVEQFDPLGEFLPSRLATVSDVYTKVLADLEEAIPNLPATATPGQISQKAANGLMSRIQLYNGNYPAVIAYAQSVVASTPVPLASELQAYWRSQNSIGVLIERPVATNSDPIIGVSYSQGNGPTLTTEYTVDKAFYDLFESTETSRRNAFIGYHTPSNTYFVNKYVQSAFGLGRNHGRYLRIEEVILNLAEAQYLNGDPGGALITLDKLRDNRYTSYTGGETGDALFAAIQLERRKELAFESDRFFTLKRLQNVPNIPSSYRQGVVRSGNGHLADGTGSPSSVLTLTPSEREWQFPLSLLQLQSNPNMTQTPGY